MNRNAQTTESSLLMHLPKSVYSFSDLSGNPFLMPVAVDNVVGMTFLSYKHTVTCFHHECEFLCY